MRFLCIEAPPCYPPWAYGWEEFPRSGDIVTLRDAVQSPWSGKQGYRFNEIRNPPADYAQGMHEIYFMEWYFRPLGDDPVAARAKEEIA